MSCVTRVGVCAQIPIYQLPHKVECTNIIPSLFLYPLCIRCIYRCSDEEEGRYGDHCIVNTGIYESVQAAPEIDRIYCAHAEC